MSVTFWVDKQTLTKELKPCPECEGTASETCNWCIDGVVTDYSSDCADLNLANANARALLYLIYPEAFLGDDPDPLTGQWSAAFLHVIIKRLIYIQNTRKAGVLESVTVEHRNPGHATLIEMGRSKKQVAHYYDRLLAVLKDAQRLESNVLWGYDEV